MFIFLIVSVEKRVGDSDSSLHLWAGAWLESVSTLVFALLLNSWAVVWGDSASSLPHWLSASKKGPKRSWESEFRETISKGGKGTGRKGLSGLREGKYFSPYLILPRFSTLPPTVSMWWQGRTRSSEGICVDSSCATALSAVQRDRGSREGRAVWRPLSDILPQDVEYFPKAFLSAVWSQMESKTWNTLLER